MSHQRQVLFPIVLHKRALGYVYMVLLHYNGNDLRTNSTQLPNIISLSKCRALESNSQKLSFLINFAEPPDFVSFVYCFLNEYVPSTEREEGMLTVPSLQRQVMWYRFLLSQA